MTTNEFSKLLDSKLDAKLQPINERLSRIEREIVIVKTNLATVKKEVKKLSVKVDFYFKSMDRDTARNIRRISRIEQVLEDKLSITFDVVSDGDRNGRSGRLKDR